MDYDRDIVDYYRKRASYYEDIYYRKSNVIRPELKEMSNKLAEYLKNRTVLEIACGTGYWTKILSMTAKQIMATDILQEMLNFAKRKTYSCPIKFQIENAFDLSFEDNAFSGGVTMFLFSHIRKEKISFFLKEFHRVLKPQAKIFIADNCYFSGIGGELVTKKDDINTYKLRKLKDNTKQLILKNYYSKNDLVDIFSKYASSFSKENIFYGKYAWCVFYKLQ